MSRQRIYAILLILGSGFLFYRTLYLSISGYLEYWVWWAATLLVAEMMVDLCCLLSSIWWFRINDPLRDRLPLRLGTAVAILHAVRVQIYVLGSTGPRNNFEVKPEYHHLFAETNWFWVWFAEALSVLGVLCVLIIWRIRLRNRRKVS